MIGKKKNSSSGDNSAGSATTSGKQDRKASCSICKETGHKWSKCSQQVWSICRETGHHYHKSPKMAKEDANVAISNPVGLVADDESESC